MKRFVAASFSLEFYDSVFFFFFFFRDSEASEIHVRTQELPSVRRDNMYTVEEKISRQFPLGSGFTWFGRFTIAGKIRDYS